tara:strand:+ start:155 stop:1078 length:924 start_codon:yes stop_codon:yes gene_type:complete
MQKMDKPIYNGVLAIAKESGPTSHDVVAKLRRIVGMRRIGHCGTLDPLATGLLVVCLGRYTRLADLLSAGTKEYEATLMLGAVSDTYDAQGEIVPVPEAKDVAIEQIENSLVQFCGDIEQIPPAFSAVKVNGVRSYRLARRNEAVQLNARTVRINNIDVLGYSYPRLSLRIECSRGTYIRSLAADLGKALGTGALVESLSRQRIGEILLQNAFSLEQIEQAVMSDELEQCFTPPQIALSNIPEVALEKEGILAFSHGNPIVKNIKQCSDMGNIYAVYDLESNLYGMGEWEEGVLKPLKVLRSYSDSP